MIKIKTNSDSINQAIDAGKGRKKETKLPGNRTEYLVKIYDPDKKEFYIINFI